MLDPFPNVRLYITRYMRPNVRSCRGCKTNCSLLFTGAMMLLDWSEIVAVIRRTEVKQGFNASQCNVVN